MSSGYHVEGYCASIGAPLQCGIKFTGESHITAVGPFVPGNFTANPSLAGPGVLIAFGFPSVIYALPASFFFLSIILWPVGLAKPESLSFALPDKANKLVRGLRAYLLGVSDTQIFLTIAYSVLFLLSSKYQCTLSFYHFDIVIDTILLSCTNFLWSTVMIADYWKTPLTAGFRYAAMFVVYVFFFIFQSYQRHPTEVPEWKPSPGRNTSAILMPAACFLDPDLDGVMSNNLTDPIKDALGQLTQPSVFPELGLGIVVCIGFVIGFVRNVCCWRQWEPWSSPIPTQVYRFVSHGVLLATTIVAWSHIFLLRSWVNGSGWIEVDAGTNPENEYRTLGQLAPLLLLALAFVPLFDEWNKQASPSGSGDESSQNPLFSNDSGSRGEVSQLP